MDKDVEESRTGHTVRIMFEASPIAMCAVAADGTIVRGNPAFRELAGAANSLLAILCAADRESVAGSLREVAGGAQRTFSAEVALEGESERWCEMSGVAMRGGSGDVMLHLVDVTERHRRESRLRELAECDPLTGAQNRLSLHRILAERLAARQTGTLLMLDLDGFKAVNDTVGHQRGDELLIAVAKALRDATPAGGVVARLGGDEFAVLLAEEGVAASSFGTTLIRQVATASTLVAGAPQVTASVGIARLRPGHDLESILAEVDLAMYAAKRAGKARCVEAGPAEPGTGSSAGSVLRVLDRDAGPFAEGGGRSYLA
jgi:diguanylate cyclase (GGDEF)-like protein/PAS domain S-box-containing protein